MKTNIFKKSYTWLTLFACIFFNSSFAQNYQLTKEIPGIPAPQGVVVDDLGKLYVVDNASSQIMVFNPSGGLVYQWGIMPAPMDIARTGTNEFYVVGLNSPMILKFNDQGIITGQINLPAGPTTSIAVDAQNNIYTVGFYPFVQKLNPAGAIIGSFPIQDPAGALSGVSVDPFGFIYVANGNGTIQKLDPNGVFMYSIPVPPPIMDVSTDVSGNVYTFSNATKTFYKFSPSGALITTWMEPTVNPGGPSFISVDKNGLVYLSNPTDGRVRVYSTSATTQTITTSVSAPYTFCPGATLAVNYSISGTFTSGNIFSAQLSNASGSFASPTIIGIVTSTSAGTINCTIPTTIAAGTGYRIRVVSNNPSVLGTDNGVNLTIAPKPAPVITGPLNVCPNTNVTYSVVNNSGSTYLWVPPAGVAATGQNTSLLAVSYTTTAGIFKVTETNAAGCATTATVTAAMGTLPNNNLIVTGPTSVCPGQTGILYKVSNPAAGATYQWTLPADATIVSGANTASLTVNWGITSGVVKVSEVNACGTGTAKSTNVTLNGGYSITSSTTFCGSGFCLPIRTLGPIKGGLIGLDFVINYTPSLVSPTGTATLGSVATSYGTYSLNTATVGKVYVSIALNNAPANTFFSGDGDIICVGFMPSPTATNGTVLNFTTDLIEESNYIGAAATCNAAPGKVTLTGRVAGNLLYRNIAGNNLLYNSATPSQYLPTDIYASDVNCVKNIASLSRPDVNGVFTFGSLYGTKVTIERDIPGDYTVAAINCSNVQSVINSSDFISALNIANYKTTAPTIYELLSADVNLDGKVTSGDASLIMSRSINATNCEFPQSTNYTWNGSAFVPAAGYTKSADWLFLDDATLALPAFTSGFGRNNVPKVPKCLGVPAGSTSCGAPAATTTYHGVLLGDVNGSWLKTDGNKLRTASNDNVITLDVANTISNGANQLIPVYYSSANTLEGIDFTLDFNSNVTIVNVLSNLGNAGSLQFNAIDNKRLMVSAAISDGLNTSFPIMYIEVKADDKLTQGSFAVTSAGYLNGDKSELTFDRARLAGTNSAEGIEVVVFPNPSNSTSVVNVKDHSSNVDVSILNSNGIEVYVNHQVPSNANFVLPVLEPGIYFVKVIGANGTTIQKMVRN